MHVLIYYLVCLVIADSVIIYDILGLETLASDILHLFLINQTELINYIPISVLSFFSKVFKKIMYTHLLDFIEQNKILYKHQYSFRQKH